MKIGILGIGHLAAYLVQGAQGARHAFILSPRNADKAAALAARYGCTVAASNQAVVDACDHVLVCLPAAKGLEILRGLTFKPGQQLCSAMAGAGLDDLRAAVAPAHATVSMMPGYANAFSAGPTFLHPPHAGWAGFFAACGPVHEIPSGRDFETAAVFGAMSGASVHFMRYLAAWYQAQGLDPMTARRLVAETLRGNAEVLLQSDASLEALCDGVTTPGGITEDLSGHLARSGAFAAWSEGMTAILHRMSPARKA